MLPLNRYFEQSEPAAIDIFAGAGGVTTGLKHGTQGQSLFNVRAAVENDPYAADTYRTNHQEVNLLEEDVNNLSGLDILASAGLHEGQCVLVTGCAPCQTFSRHGKAQPTDPRNNLVLKLAQIIVGVNPLFFLMENVPGLKDGAGRAYYEEAMSKLADAYDFIEPTINTYRFGVPQFRRRLVVIGVRKNFGIQPNTLRPIQTHEDPNKLGEGQQPWVTVRDTIAYLPRLSAGEEYVGTDSSGNPITYHSSARMGDVMKRRLSRTPHDGGSRQAWSDEGLVCHQKHQGHFDVYGRMYWNRPSPTITGGCTNVSKGRFAHPEQDRGISLREAALLQTFPPNYIFCGPRGNIALQIGNAVPVLFTRLVAERLHNTWLHLKSHPT